MKRADYIAWEAKAHLPLYPRQPVVFTRGKGVRLYDDGGRAYLDFLSGLGAVNLGHGHPKVASAVAAQARRLGHVSNLYYNVAQIRLCRRLFEKTALSAFLCNSGAEAVEAAIKFARKWGSRQGRYEIIAEEGAFHGRTYGAISAAGQAKLRQGFEPTVPGFLHVPFCDLEALKKTLSAKTCAVLLEPILGEGGVRQRPAGYLSQVETLCREHGVLLVLDEVQTGMGRTGRLFAHEHDGVNPDLICLAKSLANGFPIGCTLASERVAEALQVGDHASTFGGNPVACKAALAVLQALEKEEIVPHVAAMEKQAATFLRGLRDQALIKDYTVRGLMIGITLTAPVARQAVEQSLASGLVINATSEERIRLLPPLIIKRKELRMGLQILEEVIHGLEP